MATQTEFAPLFQRDDQFFMKTAIAMALVVVLGFSTQLVMGRSSFVAPLHVHLHAVVFMGWVAIYVAQNVLVATGLMALYRRLGWIATGWMIMMIVLGFVVTLSLVRRGMVPFFFTPLQFLVFDPLSLLTFAGLTTAAVVNRHRTDWHRRLHYCGMALLLGPAFGRLLPMPLLAPWAFEATLPAVLIFPVIGVIADLRRTGTVHRAWVWGISANHRLGTAHERPHLQPAWPGYLSRGNGRFTRRGGCPPRISAAADGPLANGASRVHLKAL